MVVSSRWSLKESGGDQQVSDALSTPLYHLTPAEEEEAGKRGGRRKRRRRRKRKRGRKKGGRGGGN